MAEVFKNAKLELGTTVGTIYTCPSATTAIVLLSQVANIHATNSADVTISWTDASDTNKSTSLVSGVIVPNKASLSVLDGKLVLESGDTLMGLASSANSLAITVSIMEMS